MRLKNIGLAFVVASVMLTTRAFAQDAGAGARALHEIQVTAKKYEFNPNVINLRKGERVRLIITATDRDHGFKLDAYQIDQHLKKGEPEKVEFTADKAGEFPFHCSVICGLGHHKMKGKVVVQE